MEPPGSDISTELHKGVVLCEVNAAFCRGFAGYWQATTEVHVKHRFSTNFWLNEIQ